MSGESSSSWSNFTSEPRKGNDETSHDNDQYDSPKTALLQSLSDVESTIKQLGHDALLKRVKDLRGKVKDVLVDQEEAMKNLQCKIKHLTDEVNSLKSEKNEMKQKFALAQVTWAWEAHVARFVVDSPEERIYKDGRFDQMSKYLKKTSWRHNLWRKIQNKVVHWTGRHWQVVNNVRKERNGVAHPDLVDFVYVERELANISPEYREKMQDMLEMLKMTASLMKFGRLARNYRNVDKLPKATRKRLNEIISWDRHFEDIDGLQNMEHEEAKQYLQRYVGNPGIIREYLYVVDLIKGENSKQLGKLAWQFEEFYRPTKQETKNALKILKELHPRIDFGNYYCERKIKISYDVARLHIPDFLPKNLWKYGIQIVGKYFHEPHELS